MNIGKRLGQTSLLFGAILAIGAPRADAQTFAQLGWFSSLQGSCYSADCTVVLFTQRLSGLQPTENDAATPVPPAILAMGSPGYIEDFTIESSFDVGPTFLSGYVLGPTGPRWSVTANSDGTDYYLLINQEGVAPLSPTAFDSAPIQLLATFSGSALGQSFDSYGDAHLDANIQAFDANGNPNPLGPYENGTFQSDPTVVSTPEPASLALIATGFLGLAGVVRRRRRI